MFSNVRKSLAPTCLWVGIFRSSSQLRRTTNYHLLEVSSVTGRDKRNKSQTQTCLFGRSNFSQGQSTEKMDLNYEDIVGFLGSKTIIFIDVREPHELEESGRIPDTINIPLGELKAAFQLPELQFLTKYGTTLPSADSPVVFHCRSGNRSRKAMEIARELGFTNVKHYAGGYLDWEKHTKGS